jgi:hypothetical protein
MNDTGMEEKGMTPEQYFAIPVEQRTKLRTGTYYPNRKQRRAARTRTEKKLGFVTEELKSVMKPYVKHS